ncbi:hypothetical protein ABKN59_005839 [Abortiporus biennis]
MSETILPCLACTPTTWYCSKTLFDLHKARYHQVQLGASPSSSTSSSLPKIHSSSSSSSLVCAHCSKKFKSAGALKSHTEAKHRTVPFICPHCSKRCCSKEELQKHSEAMHPFTFKCSHCPKQFNGQKILDLHISIYHPEPNRLFVTTNPKAVPQSIPRKPTEYDVCIKPLPDTLWSSRTPTEDLSLLTSDLANSKQSCTLQVAANEGSPEKQNTHAETSGSEDFRHDPEPVNERQQQTTSESESTGSPVYSGEVKGTVTAGLRSLGLSSTLEASDTMLHEHTIEVNTDDNASAIDAIVENDSTLSDFEFVDSGGEALEITLPPPSPMLPLEKRPPTPADNLGTTTKSPIEPAGGKKATTVNHGVTTMLSNDPRRPEEGSHSGDQQVVASDGSASHSTTGLKWVCRICLDDPSNPLVTTCGHIFCRKCFLNHLVLNDQCPVCRKDFFLSLNLRL